jgi:hypothetical protein
MEPARTEAQRLVFKQPGPYRWRTVVKRRIFGGQNQLYLLAFTAIVMSISIAAFTPSVTFYPRET